MHKIKTFLLILAGILLFSIASEARVCFLAGGSGEADESLCLVAPKFESTACPGYTICDIPRSGARSCDDNGTNYYLPEDCCSSSVYSRCDSAEGKVCTGAICLGTDGAGNLYEACESGQCSCDDSYSETCAAADGLVGVGSACNGKYQSCRCNTNYFACDANALCEGASCNDDRGELCTSCLCPTADGSEWVSDPDTCCWGYSSTCTNRPGGTTVYRCKTSQPRDCTCGYSYSSNKSGCINGCTDSNYTYQGNIPTHVVCNDYTSGIKSPCGNDCTCEIGYWDFYDQCPKQTSSICDELGYTDTSCTGKWIGCPYDSSAKKCLDALVCPAGSYTTEEACSGTGSLPLACKKDANGCWSPYSESAMCLIGTYYTEADCLASSSTVVACTQDGRCWKPLDRICPEGSYLTESACLSSDSNVLACEEGSDNCWKPSKWELYGGRCCTDLGTNTGTVYDCSVNSLNSSLPGLLHCSYRDLTGESGGSNYGRWTCKSQKCGPEVPEVQCPEGYAKSADECGSTGSKGWTLGLINNVTGCGKCTAKTCDSSYKLSTDCSLMSNPMLCRTCYNGDTKRYKTTTCMALGYRCDCVTTCSNSDISPDGLKKCLCMSNIDSPTVDISPNVPDLSINGFN